MCNQGKVGKNNQLWVQGNYPKTNAVKDNIIYHSHSTMQYISGVISQDSFFIWFKQDERETESKIPPLMNLKYCFVQVCKEIEIISLRYLLWAVI